MQVAQMKRENLYLLIGFAIPLLICLVSYWFMIFFPTIAAATKDGGGEQWLGFVGNLVGAGVTLVAAVIAWLAVQRQIEAQKTAMSDALSREIRKDEERRRHAKYSARTALAAPIATLSLVFTSVNAYLSQADQMVVSDEFPSGIRFALKDVQEAIENALRLFEQASASFVIAQVAETLEGHDRVSYLIVVSDMQFLLTTLRSNIRSTTDKELLRGLRAFRQFYRKIEGHLTLFDESLGNSFKAGTESLDGLEV